MFTTRGLQLTALRDNSRRRDAIRARSFTYQAQDGVGGAAPAMVTITVRAAVDSDGDGIPDTQDPDTISVVVSALPDSAFATGEHRKPTLNRLDDIERLIASGDIEQATSELESLRRKVDGCGAAADTNDWIVDCSAQVQVRALIDSIIAALA